MLYSSDPESQPKSVQDHWREECKRAPELSPAFPTEPTAVEVIAVSLLKGNEVMRVVMVLQCALSSRRTFERHQLSLECLVITLVY